MVLKVLVDIQGVQLLCVKAGKKHTHDEKKVYGFHIGLAFLHPLVYVIIVSPEIVCCEPSAEHGIIVIHDCLQFIGIDGICLETLIHASFRIVLARIGGICEYSSYPYVWFKASEYLVIFEKHRNRLNGKDGIVLPVEGGFADVSKDELCDFRHTAVTLFIGIEGTLIIFNQETKDILVGNGIFDHVFMKTIPEHFLCSDVLLGVFSKDGSSRESKDLEISEETDYVFMTFSEMAAVALIEDHHKLLVLKFLNTLVIEIFLDGGIELLDGSENYLLFRIKPFDQFIGIISAIDSTWFERFIFGLCLSVQIVPIHYEEDLVDTVHLSNKLCRLE